MKLTYANHISMKHEGERGSEQRNIKVMWTNKTIFKPHSLPKINRNHIFPVDLCAFLCVVSVLMIPSWQFNTKAYQTHVQCFFDFVLNKKSQRHFSVYVHGHRRKSVNSIALHELNASVIKSVSFHDFELFPSTRKKRRETHY